MAQQVFKSPDQQAESLTTFNLGDKRSIFKAIANVRGTGYDLLDVSLDDIARDTKLHEDYSMAQRRPEKWGTDINKYKISSEDLIDTYYTDPIRVYQEDGKWHIADGHHRIKALLNMGYKKAPLFVRR